MWKVDLNLKYQLVFDFSFLFSLVRCVTNVPFVDSVLRAVVLQQLSCLMKISLRSFYLCTFGALPASRTRLRKFKQQGLNERWKEYRKRKKQLISQLGKISTFKWNGGGQHRMGTELCLTTSDEGGNQRGITVFSINLWTKVAE